MSVHWPEESFYYKEMKRWDAPKRDGGENRNGFEEYPKMLYRTQQHPISGRHEVCADRDILSLDKTTVIFNAEQFNASCQVTVRSKEEEERYIREGWRTSQAEAVQFHEDELTRIATAAALRNRDDRNMSERAKAEAQKADDSTPHHLPEVPVSPVTQARRDSLAKARAAKAAKREKVSA